MYRVISLDPGRTTGYLIANVTEDADIKMCCEQSKFSHVDLWSKLTFVQPQAIICESFEYRNTPQGHRNDLDLYPCEMIGVVQLYNQLTISVDLRMQSAAQGKGHFTDDKLKKLDLYDKSHRHGRDAVRHFMQWFTFGPGFKFNRDQGCRLVSEEEVMNA